MDLPSTVLDDVIVSNFLKRKDLRQIQVQTVISALPQYADDSIKLTRDTLPTDFKGNLRNGVFFVVSDDHHRCAKVVDTVAKDHTKLPLYITDVSIEQLLPLQIQYLTINVTSPQDAKKALRQATSGQHSIVILHLTQGKVLEGIRQTLTWLDDTIIIDVSCCLENLWHVLRNPPLCEYVVIDSKRNALMMYPLVVVSLLLKPSFLRDSIGDESLVHVISERLQRYGNDDEFLLVDCNLYGDHLQDLNDNLYLLHCPDLQRQLHGRKRSVH